METKELFLKTLFCCSACDGDIAPSEIALIKNIITGKQIFAGLNVEALLNEYVKRINEKGKLFLKEFLNELSVANMSDNDQITLIDLAIQMIEADNVIQYSEVQFFKKVRWNLSISDEAILAKLPIAEDYLLPDIVADDKEIEWPGITFEPIHFDELLASDKN